MDVKVGDTVYHVPTRRLGEPSYAYVVGIGRKWVSWSLYPERGTVDFRFDKSTGYVDGKGYSSPATVYASREEHEAATLLYKAWSNARLIVNGHFGPPPAGVTVERIREAMKLLGLDMTGRVEL